MGTLTTNRNRTPRILLLAEVSLSLLPAGCTSSGSPEASAPSATEKAPAETSAETERVDDSTLQVTYKYPQVPRSGRLERRSERCGGVDLHVGRGLAERRALG